MPSKTPDQLEQFTAHSQIANTDSILMHDVDGVGDGKTKRTAISVFRLLVQSWFGTAAQSNTSDFAAANHGHTSAGISDFTEAAQNATAALFANGTHSGVTFNYNNAANSLSAVVTGGSGGTGVTNLSLGTITGTTIEILSDTGTDVTLQSATSTNAGLLSATNWSKLDGIAPNATANATDVQLRDRQLHTGEQAISTVTGLQSALDSKVATTAVNAVNGVAGLDANSKINPLQLPPLTKSDVGLTNVDNTSDANKPISTATQTALDAKQPLDSDLTSIAALTTTTFGRSLLTQADAAALRTTAGLVVGTDVQAFDSDLASIAALTTTTFGRSLLTQADAAALRTTAGLVIGTNVQAFDSDLASIAALTTTTFGRSLLTQADALAVRTTIDFNEAVDDRVGALIQVDSTLAKVYDDSANQYRLRVAAPPSISGSGHFIRVPFSATDTMPKLLFTTVDANTRVISARVILTNGIDGTGVTVTIGDSGNNSSVMAAATVNTPQTPNVYEARLLPLFPTVGTAINLYINGTGITQGGGLVILEIDPAVTAAGGGVASVFNRTGAVNAEAGDYAAFYQTLLSAATGPISFNDKSLHRYSTRTRIITTTNYELTAADNGLQLVFSNANPIIVTVPPGLYWVDLGGGEFEGFGCDIAQGAAGQVTVVGATTPSTVTIKQRENKFKLAGIDEMATLRPTGVQNQYRLAGALVA